MFAAPLFAFAVAMGVAAAPCEPDIKVHGHALELEPGRVVDTAPLALEMQARAPALFAHAAAFIGLETCPRVDVELVSAIEGAVLLDPPWHLPPWAAGASASGERRVVVAITAKGQQQDRERVLLHELAHVAVAERTGGAAPRWLDEGVARVIANEEASADLTALAKARLGNRLLPLSALDAAFPRRDDLAQLAYAESARAVAAIIERGGADAPARLLGHLGAGEPLDDALLKVTGRRLWQLERDVERALPMWRAAAVVGVETDLAFAACALVVAWAGVRARRRIRAAIAAYDALGFVPSSAGRSAGGDSPIVLARWKVSGAGSPSG